MSKSNPTEGWLSGWQSLQEQFAHAWKDTAGAAQAAAPLMEGFAQWARLAGGDDTGNEALDRMVGGARQMVQMMQSALQKGVGDGSPSSADWTAAIASALGGVGPSANPMLNALRQVAGEGARGFEEMFAAFGAAVAPLRKDFQSMLQLPAFGYLRESQERHQHFALALDQYREQADHYNRLMADASRRALQKLEFKLAEHSEPGRQLKSWRELYDTWIDAAEEGYAEVALSTEFRQAYGALVNAQMRVRRHVQQEIERSAAQLGMPTRGELDAVHRKLGALARRVAELDEGSGVIDTGAVAKPAAASLPRKPAKAARLPRKPAKAAPSPRKPAKAVRATRRTKAAVAVRRARAAATAPAPKKAGKPLARGAAKAGSNFAERLAAVRKAARKPSKKGR